MERGKRETRKENGAIKEKTKSMWLIRKTTKITKKIKEKRSKCWN